MIISCPSCKTLFRAPNELALEAPQAMQCGLCGHDWKMSRHLPTIGMDAWRYLAGVLLSLFVVLVVAAVLLRAPLTAHYPGMAPLWEQINIPAGEEDRISP